MKFNKIITSFAAVALVSVMTSCSDDDVATPIASDAEVENSGASYDKLSFEWDKIGGAIQYGYELIDGDGNVVCRDVTTQTSATIGSLQPSTEYTLKVWGYPAIGSGYVQSEPVVIKATTDPLKTLAAPTVSGSQAEVTYTVSWRSVTGATGYEYTLTNAAGDEISSSTTTSRSVEFTHLDNGNYTIAVKALSTTPGYEATGEVATFDFTSDIVELWSAEGTYTSAVLGKSWDAKILCYGGGHYTIVDWYGIKGYNIDFYTDNSDAESSFKIYDYYDYNSSTGAYQVPTGRSDIGALNVYPWYNESSIDGTSMAGSAKICVLLNGSDVYDTYTWKGEYDGIAADEFVGTWNVHTEGFSWISNVDGEFLDDGMDFDENSTIEITKIDNNTISMPAPFFSKIKLTVKIDMIEGVLTADPVPGLFTWYTFAGESSETSKVIGTINSDGSFEFNDWNAWCDGEQYTYYTTAKYTKK